LGFISRLDQGLFSTTVPRLALAPRSPIEQIPKVKRPEREAKHSPISRAEVTMSMDLGLLPP